MINKKIISENKFQFSGPANLEMYDRRHSDETGRDSWERVPAFLERETLSQIYSQVA